MILIEAVSLRDFALENDMINVVHWYRGGPSIAIRKKHWKSRKINMTVITYQAIQTELMIFSINTGFRCHHRFGNP